MPQPAFTTSAGLAPPKAQAAKRSTESILPSRFECTTCTRSPSDTLNQVGTVDTYGGRIRTREWRHSASAIHCWAILTLAPSTGAQLNRTPVRSELHSGSRSVTHDGPRALCGQHRTVALA